MFVFLFHLVHFLKSWGAEPAAAPPQNSDHTLDQNSSLWTLGPLSTDVDSHSYSLEKSVGFLVCTDAPGKAIYWHFQSDSLHTHLPFLMLRSPVTPSALGSLSTSLASGTQVVLWMMVQSPVILFTDGVLGL